MNRLFSWFLIENGDNPYESPQALGSPDSNRLAREEKCRVLGRLFWQWERLRILFNAVLGVEAVVLTAMIGFVRADLLPSATPLRFCKFILLGCLAANLLFCLGYYTNAYLAWLGFRQRIYTALIFLGGLLIAAGLTALAIVSVLMPLVPD
ncbi:MAG: hypothetical protein IT426_15840 [Pirellulales bacterium]|nr:hypothetical protein [Pirellulales bacterium]